jgi:Ran GTPase-activating protein (RanGAP) involved in mRNA processing and transport
MDNMDSFMNEIEQIMANYEKELEAYRRMSKSALQGETVCMNCDKLTDELTLKEQEIKKLQKENRQIKDSKGYLEAKNINIYEKYSKLELHINTMIDDITSPESVLIKQAKADLFPHADYILQDSTDNLTEEESRNNWLIEIFTEVLFKDYKLAHSITLPTLNKKLLGNYTSYLNTIFINQGSLLSCSIVQEYLQDIFLKVYHTYLENMDLKREYNWVISEEDIKNKEVLINLIVSEVIKNNPISAITEKDYNIENKIDHLIFKYNIKKNANELKDQIKVKLDYKINSYLENLKEDIKKIVLYSIKFIHAGKLVNKTLIYDYWKFYYDFNSLIKKDKTIFYYQSLEAPDHMDNLITHFKYNNNTVENLKIQGNIELSNDYILPLNVLLIPIISYCKNLKTLIITDTKFSNKEDNMIFLQKALELSKLVSIDLSNNNIEDKGCRCIMDAMKFNNSLKSLNLSFNNITTNGGFYIADMLMKNKTIDTIILGGNNITDNGLQSLANVLASNNRTVKYLDLSNNKLKSNDIIFIANMLTKNSPLAILNLSNNKLDLDSVTNIGLSLKENNNLKCLYVNNINLNEESSPYFLQYLIDTHIEELHVDANNLGEVGGILFANVIKYNKYLVRASMKKTKLNSTALICLSHALESNQKYQLLELNENDFNDDAINILNNAVGNKDIKISLSPSLLSTNAKNIVMNNKNFII